MKPALENQNTKAQIVFSRAGRQWSVKVRNLRAATWAWRVIRITFRVPFLLLTDTHMFKFRKFVDSPIKTHDSLMRSEGVKMHSFQCSDQMASSYNVSRDNECDSLKHNHWHCDNCLISVGSSRVNTSSCSHHNGLFLCQGSSPFWAQCERDAPPGIIISFHPVDKWQPHQASEDWCIFEGFLHFTRVTTCVEMLKTTL